MINSAEVLGKLHDFISQPALFAIFGLLCVFFAVSSLILVFHWNKYAIDKSAIVTAHSIYFLVGSGILLLAFISIILY